MDTETVPNFSALLPLILEEDVQISEFVQWHQEIALKQNISPPAVLRGKFSPSQIETIGKEFGVILLNFLRTQAVNIIENSSRHNSTTPSKSSSRYDYLSPVKALTQLPQARPHNSGNGNPNRKKALFAQNDGGSNERKTTSTRNQELKPANISLDLNSGQNHARRGLDSEQNRNSGRRSAEKDRRRSGGSAFKLEDFIKTKPEKKKKGRKSGENLAPKTVVEEPAQKKRVECLPASRDSPVNPMFNGQSRLEGKENSPLGVSIIDDGLLERKIDESNAAQAAEKKTDPIIIPTPTKRASEDMVQVSLEKVKDKEKLEKLADLYAYCIDRNLIPNINTELYFVLELLTLQIPRSEEVNDNLARIIKGDRRVFYLDNIHNCVYFAIQVLNLQYDSFYRYCDRNTLKFLHENPRIQHMSPALLDRLRSLARRESSSGQVSLGLSRDDGGLESVRFHSETDNRENFPSNLSFQDFKKQRDLFYEILREWQADQNQDVLSTPGPVNTGVEFAKKFSKRVEELLCLQSHPTGLIHFARLFQSQLLSMCRISDDQFDIDDSSLELKRTDPRKFKLLHKRMVTSSNNGGPCPNPGFPGPQEFFKNFLKCCNHHTFLSHLKDNMVATITQINAMEFNLTDDSDKELASSNLASDEVSSSIITLRVLAKFLGYMDSLPYRCTPESLNDQMTVHQVTLRSKFRPSIDIYGLLRYSLQSKRLTVTLPWIIEYCAMLDFITMRVAYFQKVFQLIMSIYRIVLPVGSEYKLAENNRFFLRLNIGWLLENHLFPTEIFQQAFLHIDKDEATEGVSIDEFEGLSESLLYVCCPYLSASRVLLREFAESKSLGKKDGGYPRKPVLMKAPVISPTDGDSTDIAHFGESPKKRNVSAKATNSGRSLQNALEENFFKNQPQRFKKHVDYVSENIASNMARIIRTEIAPEEKAQSIKKMKERIESVIADSPKDDLDTRKTDLVTQLVLPLAEASRDAVKRRSMALLREQVLKKCDSALRSLLGDDASDAVIGIASAIAARKAVQLAKRYIADHVSTEHFSSDYRNVFGNLWRKALASEPAAVSLMAIEEDSREDGTPIVSPARILIEIKGYLDFMCVEQKVPDDLTSLRVNEILQQIMDFATDSRIDLKEMQLALKGLESMTVDWALALLAYKPMVMTAAVQDNFISLWKLDRLSQDARIISLLCPRNILLLSQSITPVDTWNKLEALISRAMKADLILPLILEDQCLRLLKQEWPRETLCRLRSCLSGVVESWKRLPRKGLDVGEQQEFVALMDWFVWYFSEADDLDGPFEELHF